MKKLDPIEKGNRFIKKANIVMGVLIIAFITFVLFTMRKM